MHYASTSKDGEQKENDVNIDLILGSNDRNLATLKIRTGLFMSMIEPIYSLHSFASF